MALNQAAVYALWDSVKTHCLTLALFGGVTTHEAKSKPAGDMSAEIWSMDMRPLPQVSGLGETAGLITFHIRIRTPMLAKPEDDTDKKLMSASLTVIGEYSGSFTLGGTVMAVDLLGMHGTALGAQLGYLEQDGTLFRVSTVTLPIILDNLWTQGA
jgi:hypothetical protein